MSVYFSPNENRYVTLSLTNITTDNTWRNNLSRILNNAISTGAGSTEKASIIDSTNISKLNVKSSINLLMEEDIPKITATVSTKKGFSELIKKTGKTGEALKDGTTKVLNLVGGVTSVVEGLDGKNSSSGNTFNPWPLEAPTWEDDKLYNVEEIKYTFEFRMGQYGLWNAKEEVVLPILNLIAPTLPQKLGSTYTSGPLPSVWNLIGRALGSSFDSLSDYVEDPNSLSSFSNIWNSDSTNIMSQISATLTTSVNFLGNLLTAVLLSGYKNYAYTLKFGKFCTFSKVIYKSANWSFSSEVDQFGYPIYGKVELEFTPLVPIALSSTNATTKALTYGISQGF